MAAKRTKRKGIAARDALQKRIATQEQYNPTDDGFIEPRGEDESLVRGLIALAMVFDATGSVVKMDPDLSNDLGIVLDIDAGIHTFKAFIYGWHPTLRITVAELLRDFQALGEVGFTCEDVAKALRTQRAARALLLDGIERKEASDSMLRELDTISKTVWPRLDALQVLTNWRGPIPTAAAISLTVPQLKEEVRP